MLQCMRSIQILRGITKMCYSVRIQQAVWFEIVKLPIEIFHKYVIVHANHTNWLQGFQNLPFVLTAKMCYHRIPKYAVVKPACVCYNPHI